MNAAAQQQSWHLDVDDVRTVTVQAWPEGVDVRVERGSAGAALKGLAPGLWTGVHARRALLKPEQAEHLAQCLLAAAAAARAWESGT